MGDVVALGSGAQTHPDAVSEGARAEELKKVVVIGWRPDGSFYFSGSEAIDMTIFLMRNAEYELFKFMDRTEGE